MEEVKILAYYYPGWHYCPLRQEELPPEWKEWDLVYRARQEFPGQDQPNLPLWGPYDDALSTTFSIKIEAAQQWGIDGFVFAFYWSRGKRILQRALDEGFLPISSTFPFALMWANRMPRKVLPVKKEEQRVIDPNRLVYTDPEDFLQFIQYLAKNYFHRPNYFKIHGRNYFSIFDTNFFIRQLGPELAQHTISLVRSYLRKEGLPDLHLGAIDPIPQFQPLLAQIGFDSVTHYVYLPEWKGPLLQDYQTMAEKRSKTWEDYLHNTHLPYFPSVSPGWDATPRGELFGPKRPHRYPWSPIIIHRHPQKFASILRQAVRFAYRWNPSFPLCLIASFNEWSEGHYLEPDERYGYDWLKAVYQAKKME